MRACRLHLPLGWVTPHLSCPQLRHSQPWRGFLGVPSKCSPLGGFTDLDKRIQPASPEVKYLFESHSALSVPLFLLTFAALVFVALDTLVWHRDWRCRNAPAFSQHCWCQHMAKAFVSKLWHKPSLKSSENKCPIPGGVQGLVSRCSRCSRCSRMWIRTAWSTENCPFPWWWSLTRWLLRRDDL